MHITGSGADFAAGVSGIVAEEERKVTNRFAREAEARAVAMEQQALEHAEGLVSERDQGGGYEMLYQVLMNRDISRFDARRRPQARQPQWHGGGGSL